MTKNQATNQAGEKISPGLAQSKDDLQASANLANQSISSLDSTNRAIASKGLSNTAAALTTCSQNSTGASCKQVLWFSFFFDGTGNNLEADHGTLEHSNVARLFRVMPKDDQIMGQYRFYIPGIGTYFKDIGDEGGGILGSAFGKYGEARLKWALEQFDKKIAYHLGLAANPANAITEINIAAFGFSRGATLARAFIRDFIQKKCKATGDKLHLQSGGWPVRIRFMGLFDTVAAIGRPIGQNNLAMNRTKRWSWTNTLRYGTQNAPTKLGAEELAFGPPGADPAPGSAHGHDDWAKDLRIRPHVELAVHYIAAHEIRNSFPVDSVFEGGVRPPNCKEMIYPGAHSNVGGGYRPGEGGKSGQAVAAYASHGASAPKMSDLLLSLIPLRHMYDEAIQAGVPLIPIGRWTQDNKDDFRTSPVLQAAFNYYLSKVGANSLPIGKAVNAHMALYYAWRFAQINRKKKGDRSEKERLAKHDEVFEKDKQAIDQELRVLEIKKNAAKVRLDQATQQKAILVSGRGMAPYQPGEFKAQDARIAAAKREYDAANEKYLELKAKRDTMPSKKGSLAENIDSYDEQLMLDAKWIRQACQDDPSKRKNLRPHYKGLLEAYENEFIHGKGLNDQKIYDFFEYFIHDSLSDFDLDSTLPSDPRVIYLGGDVKSKHASIEVERHASLAIA